MTKKYIQCSLAGLGTMMALWAQGQRGFNRIGGSGHRGLREDDSAVGSGMAWVIGVTGSGMAQGAQHHRLREDDVGAGSGTALRAWGRGLRGARRHRLRGNDVKAPGRT
jgi:hypothetical protein